MASTFSTGTSSRPLFILEDPTIRDDLLRLAAAACVEPLVAIDMMGGRPAWQSASAVFIDEDIARQAIRYRLPPRQNVTIVATGETPSEATWSLASSLHADHVVCLPAAEPWLVDRLSPPHRELGQAPIIGVMGGRGGAGASVLVAALGTTAIQLGARPLLVDADVLGSGLDVLLGTEDIGGARWAEAIALAGDTNLSAQALRDALPRLGKLSVLSWDRWDTRTLGPEAMGLALSLGQRASDLVLVDLPRYCDPASLAAVQSADLVILVVPAEVRAAVAANRVAAVIGTHCTQLRGIVRGPAPAGLRTKDLAQVLTVGIIGEMEAESGLAVSLEKGEPPAFHGQGPLVDMCKRLLAEFAGIGRTEQGR